MALSEECCGGYVERIEQVNLLLERELRLKHTDTFIFDATTGNYMAVVLPFAVRHFVTNKTAVQMPYYGHQKNIGFKDLTEMTPGTVHCLEAANIHTIGDLAQLNGVQAFSALENKYDRVAELVYVYYKNNIPSELLDDVVKVADEYRKVLFLELEERLETVTKATARIKNDLNRIAEKLHEMEAEN